MYFTSMETLVESISKSVLRFEKVFSWIMTIDYMAISCVLCVSWYFSLSNFLCLPVSPALMRHLISPLLTFLSPVLMSWCWHFCLLSRCQGIWTQGSLKLLSWVYLDMMTRILMDNYCKISLLWISLSKFGIYNPVRDWINPQCGGP